MALDDGKCFNVQTKWRRTWFVFHHSTASNHPYQTNQINTNTHNRLLPSRGTVYLHYLSRWRHPRTVPWVDGSQARCLYESAFALSGILVDFLFFVSEWANCMYFRGFSLLFPCLHLRWVTYHGYPSHPQKKKRVLLTASIKMTLNQAVSPVCPWGSFGFLSFFLFSTHSTPFSSIPIQNTNDKRKDWPNFKVSSNLADQSGLTGISLPNHKHLIIYYHKPDFPLSEDEWDLHLPHWWKTFGSLCLEHWPAYWQGRCWHAKDQREMMLAPTTGRESGLQT